MDSVIETAIRLACMREAKTITSKNFAPIDRREREGGKRFGAGPLADAVSAVGSWLGEFEHKEGRPFWAVCTELYRVASDVPSTPEELKRSDWSTRVNGLLQQVELDIAQGSWGDSTAFLPLLERITEVRLVLTRSQEQWTTDAEVDGETAVLIVVGEPADVDRYVAALGEQVRKVRGSDDPSDELVIDEEHSFAPFGRESAEGSSRNFLGAPSLSVYGESRSPKIVQLCEPMPRIDVESLPRLERLFDSLVRVADGLISIPGQPFKDVLLSIVELAQGEDFAESLREKGPKLAVQLQAVASELSGSSIALPDSAKSVLRPAVEEAAREFAKCANIPAQVQRDVTVRLVTIAALGTRSVITSLVSEAIGVDESSFVKSATQGAESEVELEQPVAS